MATPASTPIATSNGPYVNELRQLVMQHQRMEVVLTRLVSALERINQSLQRISTR